jgi:hypothetical protein
MSPLIKSSSFEITSLKQTTVQLYKHSKLFSRKTFDKEKNASQKAQNNIAIALDTK